MAGESTPSQRGEQRRLPVNQEVSIGLVPIIILGTINVVCAILVYAMIYAKECGEDERFSQRLYGDQRYADRQRRVNQGFAVGYALLFGLFGGPIVLIVVWCFSGFAQHGLRFR